jgi:hypothetical protein
MPQPAVDIVHGFENLLIEDKCVAGRFGEQEICSQNQQFLPRSFPDRGERNAGIKGNEPSFMLNRESKQVYVGQLPRSMNSGRVHDIRIQHTDFIRPEFMDILVAGLG